MQQETMTGSLFPLFSLRVKCQNHEMVPIFPILVANIYSSCQDMDHQNKGNRNPLNVFPCLSCHLAKTWTTKIGEIGEIGTLSWFWHFTLRGNRANRDPLSIFPWWSAKTMKRSLFPLFWWPMSIHPVKKNRGNRGNRDPLMVLALHP